MYRFSNIPVALGLISLLSSCTLLTNPTQAGPIITNEVHAEHIGEAVFATRMIPNSKRGLPPLATSFAVATDAIWGRVYLGKPIAQVVGDLTNQACDSGKARVLIKAKAHPEIELDRWSFSKRSWKSWTTFRPTEDGKALLNTSEITVPAKPTQIGQPSPSSHRLLTYLLKLPNGPHEMTVRAEAGCKATSFAQIASGRFRIEVNARSRKALLQRFRLPKPAFHDHKAAKMIRALMANQFTDGGSTTHVRMITPWRIQVNALGAPLAKQVTAIALRSVAGQCLATGYLVRSAHMGGGRYDKPVIVNHPDSRFLSRPVPCGIDVSR